MIYNLQALRSIAALSVVYLHVASGAGLNLSTGFGGYGVDLFFVISGFTMAHIGAAGAGNFLLRRCIRIIPLYWTATIGTFVVAWVAPSMIETSAADFSHLLHSLLFLPFPNKLGRLQPTLALGWTLNYEMYFYALFSVALLVTVRAAPALAAAMLVGATVLIRLFGGQGNFAVFYGDSIVYEFVLGIAVYGIAGALAAAGAGAAQRGPARAGLLAVIVLSAVMLPLQERLLFGDRVLWAGIPSAILVLGSVLIETKFNIAVTNRWVILLGDSSYVLYLVHPYVVYGIIRLVLNPKTMQADALAFAAVTLPIAAALVAMALHVCIEKPALRSLRRLIEARPGPRQPAAA